MDTRRIYTRSELIAHIKRIVSTAERIGLDRLIKGKRDPRERTSAIALADDLAYMMDAQTWINPTDDPLLDKIWEYAVDVDNDHTNREAWAELFRLIQELE